MIPYRTSTNIQYTGSTQIAIKLHLKMFPVSNQFYTKRQS